LTFYFVFHCLLFVYLLWWYLWSSNSGCWSFCNAFSSWVVRLSSLVQLIWLSIIGLLIYLGCLAFILNTIYFCFSLVTSPCSTWIVLTVSLLPLSTSSTLPSLLYSFNQITYIIHSSHFFMLMLMLRLIMLRLMMMFIMIMLLLRLIIIIMMLLLLIWYDLVYLMLIDLFDDLDIIH